MPSIGRKHHKASSLTAATNMLGDEGVKNVDNKLETLFEAIRTKDAGVCEEKCPCFRDKGKLKLPGCEALGIKVWRGKECSILG